MLSIVVLRKILKSPLHYTEIKSVTPRVNQPWIFIKRPIAEAKTPILWPPGGKSRLTGKDLDAGEDQQNEKRVAEDEMVG